MIKSSYLFIFIMLLMTACNNSVKEQVDDIDSQSLQLEGGSAVKESLNQYIGSDQVYDKVKVERENITLVGTLQVPPLKEGEKVPVVILMHGLFDSRQTHLLAEIADNLMNIGIASFRFDFNGHGQSDGEFQNMTVLNEIEDAFAVYEYITELDFVSSISLLGHSQGGVVASMLAGQLGSEIEKLILLAPAGVIQEDSLDGEILGARFNPSNLPESIMVYGRQIGREFLQTAQTLPIYEESAKYTGPVSLIHGSSDRTVHYRYSERYHDIYENSKLHILDGQDHSFYRDMNEVVNLVIDCLK